MKSFILIAALSALAFTSRAQFGSASTFPLIAGDTLVNTDTVFKVVTATAGYKDLGVQALINKLTGTALTGKLILWASMDGVNYVATDSATYAITTASSLVTPTFTHSAIIAKTGTPYTYYAVLVTNSAGSATGQVRVKYTLRRTQATIVQ